ncbi:unnamed protein product [Diatraea saccharalis]|uniref:SprT-like domain-containing protein n=1 Tax=Diatraea saccharalis TaxID=40085 RepID=A0A9N9RG67_9NEOP|nr:unnamed protein product [Diatraea saccharalis]
MDNNKKHNTQKNRFLKLSLKKNKIKMDDDTKLNRSSDVIVLEESFERLKSDFPRSIQSTPKIYSPIVINDSCDSYDSLPEVQLIEHEPSKRGNVSINKSIEEKSPMNIKESKPSIGGWSPAQSITCATPRYKNLPSIPKEVANESLEECSIKKIQHSQKKLLNDLYGEQWKSIPKLFKTLSKHYDNFNGISKKLHFDEDESDKENIRHDLKRNKELYLTSSDVKKNLSNLCDTERKSKKKLYTEKVPSTPDIPRSKTVPKRNINSTTKKIKAASVTELVDIMNKEVNGLTKKVEHMSVISKDELLKRLTFVGSLADEVPTWRCHPEAFQYRDNYKTMREQLTRRLYIEFNKEVFDNALEEDMPVIWDTKLRSTAGTTTNRLLKNSKGDRRRTSSIKLSTKVVDGPQRLRDTLIHELCHSATWIIDGELRAGHGPLWKKWATCALRKYPELGEISRCHNMQIHFKYCYKCTKCGYSIQRHSKSIDITKKCCGYCRGTFELTLNKKTKDGAVVSTPARKGETNEFALYVKENYGTLKNGRKHAEVMKMLGEQFSAKKRLGI